MTEAVYITPDDVQKLVEDGFLDLDAVFARAEWSAVDTITTYTQCTYGPNGDEPGQVEIVLESATQYGIKAYRWRERDDAGSYDSGPITLSRAEALAAGEQYADDNNDAPDEDDVIRQIVDTGYFGDASAEEIREICEAATQYSQGVLLLPAGEFCGRPVGRTWTTGGYLQGDHVALRASHHNTAAAAVSLLHAITDDSR